MKRLEPLDPTSPTYRQIWRVVDGALRSALAAHPHYAPRGVSKAKFRSGIVKRVTGALHGYAEQSDWRRSQDTGSAAEAADARSGSSPARDMATSACGASGHDGVAPLAIGGRGPPSSAPPPQPQEAPR